VAFSTSGGTASRRCLRRPVVALPTTRQDADCEIAALMALACGKRVLIVTPLRALSAQTERSFRKTFTPLGFSVSSLYGSSGIAGNDEDALREQNIVIATPEKLDLLCGTTPTSSMMSA
jgi:replicative superfamily II helicase